VPVCGSRVAVSECAHPVDVSIEAVFGDCSGGFGGSALFGYDITQFCRLVTAFCPAVSFVRPVSPQQPSVEVRCAHVEFSHGPPIHLHRPWSRGCTDRAQECHIRRPPATGDAPPRAFPL
jgi:hypothetical protein